ncbi:HAD-IC family P-type ATPase [Nocardia higoensis]|uniref:HAD-IC family P-type ATPase n=2 Tax=Nocardia higoensis TaxID=228599 RepID=A0ABS0DFA7_9NOCA|nr:HAD-IC family P-type ATPase [Nocardia higoensis]
MIAARMISAIASLPARCVYAGTRAVTAGATVTADTVVIGAGTVVGVSRALLRPPAGVAAAAASVPREVIRPLAGLARESVGGAPARRCGFGENRMWIDVRGLDTPHGRALGERVLEAVRSTPGVRQAELHRPWSRIVVTSDGSGPAPQALCRIVSAVEKSCGPAGSVGRPVNLPGDDVVLAGHLIAAGTTLTALWVTLGGRLLRLPRLPGAVAAPVIATDYQPRARAVVENAIGEDAADLVFAVATAAVYTLSRSPASLAVDATTRIALLAEALSGRRAWRAQEPALATRVTAEDHPPSVRSGARPDGPIERYAGRAGRVGLVGAAGVGAVSANPVAAGTAAMVAAPKATRSAREVFAATLGRGLNERHGVLVLRPAALRRLDRVDTVVIDPRALYTATLGVSRVLGVREHDRTRVWEAARESVARGALTPGWHPVSAVPGAPREADAAGRVLVSPVHDRYASAVIAEARRAGVRVISVDDDALRSLRNGFDDLHPLGGSLDRTLSEVVAKLRRDGATVAVIAADAPLTLASADVGIGITRDGLAPAWGAHLLATDLTGVWRVLRALPAARSASRRGVELSRDASLLGTLLLVPGVPGTGTEPVTAGAAGGLWAGYTLARDVLAAPLPVSRSGHEWHAMPIAEARRLLPAPPEDDVPAGHGSPVALITAPTTRLLGTRPVTSTRDFVRAVRAELSDPLTPVLATCAAASAVLGSPLDAVLVGSVLMLDASISATQRLRAEQVLKRLLAVQDPPARRITGPGRYLDVAAAGLRPGDVIEIRPGEVAPVDGRLLEAPGVEVDESSLTGESLPVTKQTEPTPGAPLAERSCMIYAGTTVLTGTAIVLVTSVGQATEKRRATAMAPAKVREVGLQSQLSALTRRSLPISFGGGALVTAFGLLRGTGLRAAVISGVAITVAAVPEGLPLVATLAQASAARRLTRSGALVRAPRAIEALGRVEVVCFDKTGTLSENRLRVSAVEPAPGFSREQVLAYAARTARPENGGPPDHATDVAVIEAADAGHAYDDGRRDAYLPFRSGRSYAAAIAGTHLAVKGAPEAVLAAYTDQDPVIAERVRSMAAAGLRVIAVGQREITARQAEVSAADPDTLAELAEHQLRPVGLLGLSDTPRADAVGLIPALLEQNIAVRLITGDHPVTALAIAEELGLPVTADQVISGAEWDTLSQTAQEHAVADCLVFARMSPENKVQIVQTLERAGRVSAMVGDGANDAAAIRAAGVGIGVASRGSDPARGAADIVLLDGRVGALLDGLDEGRRLWRRVNAAVAVLLGGNAGEVAFALLGSLVTGHSPLNARQLLLVNMLTDALPAAALAVAAPNHTSPDRTSPDRNGDHDMAGATHATDQSALLRTITVRGATTAAGATAAWTAARLTGRPRRASTVALIALVGSQLGQTLIDSRSPLVVSTAAGSLAVMAALISTPGISQFLGCVPVGPVGWALGLGSAATATAAAGLAPELVVRLSGFDAIERAMAGNGDGEDGEDGE